MHTFTLLRAFVATLGLSMVSAQNDLPDLSEVTGAATATTTTSAASTTTGSAATTSGATATTSGSTSLFIVSLSSVAASSTSQQSLQIVSLSALPTVAGAGIPTMIVPYTADAPFMQESNLPEGTVFIAVGAVLAFLGACVILWRGLVAWSINRSVKRAALASIRGGSEKPSTNWGGSNTGYNSIKGGLYKETGDTMSMEALTASGKPVRSHFKDHDTGRGTPPPQNLFFSPTAHARTEAARPLSELHGNRNSSYLPAGYYAAPNSHVAGGARNTIVGGGPAPPYARNSVYEPSPPSSPTMRPTSAAIYGRPSHDQLRAPSRDGMRGPTLYNQPSNSSLAVGLNSRPSGDGLAGSRAPSAYLDDLFENHTAMASRDHL